MKYLHIRQHSEEDCGAACLAVVAQHHRKTFGLSRIRDAVGTGKQGTTLLGLRRGAEALGFNARSAKASAAVLQRMDELPLPAIISWKGYHYVVLYGKRRRRYVISDPAIGVRYLTQAELMEGWGNGTLLLLEPDMARFFEQPDDKSQGLARFFRRIKPYVGALFESFLINLFVGALALTSPFLIQILTDDVLIRGDVDLLRGVAIAIIAMTAIKSLLGLVQANLIAQFAQRLELGLVMEFGRKILQLPLSYYESRRSGEIISRLGDIQQINQLVSQVVIGLPSQFFIALISLGLMLFYSPQLTLVTLVLAALSMATAIAFMPILQQKVRRSLILDAENQGVLVETFKGALTIKTTAAQDQFWEELQGRFSRLARLSFGTTQIGIINGTFSGLVGGIGSVVLLWFGSSLVIQRELSIGQLMAFNAMSGNVIGFIGAIVGFVDEFFRVKTATERLTEVIDTQTETEAGEHKAYVRLQPNANIMLSDVSFHHSGRVNLLEQLSLVIPGGKTTALIGRSGCGKSSLAKLIAGLYPYASGNIRIGAFNLEDLVLDCLRQQAVLVPQEAHFWSRSILENFRLGAPQVSFEQIVYACQITGADQFISQLPDKYQTVLGEFGANLSGGQRQRLAVARGILNDPPILILDESTASLDPMSEAEMLEQLLRSRRNKTTLMISHRPSVIERADWVIFMEDGQVRNQGTVERLRSQPGSHLNFLLESPKAVSQAT